MGEAPAAEVGRDRVRTSDRGILIEIGVKVVLAVGQDVVPGRRHVGGCRRRDSAGRQASGSVGDDDPTGGESCSVMDTWGGRVRGDIDCRKREKNVGWVVVSRVEKVDGGGRRERRRCIRFESR